MHMCTSYKHVSGLMIAYDSKIESNTIEQVFDLIIRSRWKQGMQLALPTVPLLQPPVQQRV